MEVCELHDLAEEFHEAAVECVGADHAPADVRFDEVDKVLYFVLSHFPLSEFPSDNSLAFIEIIRCDPVWVPEKNLINGPVYITVLPMDILYYTN